MNWFRNQRTVVKLMITSAIMAVCIGVIGYQGLRASRELNENLNELYAKHMIGMAEIKDARIAIAMVGREARQILLEKEAAAKEQSSRKLETQLNGFLEHFSAAERTFVTEEARAMAAKIRQYQPEYAGRLREMTRFSVDHDDKNALDALARAVRAGEQLNEVLANFASLKDKLGKQAVEDGNTSYASLRQTLFLSLAFAVIAAIVLGWVTAKVIATPLQQMVSTAGRLARGELDQKLDYRSEDEAGKLADALREMISGFSAPIREASDVLSQAAARDLTVRMKGECKGDFGAIKTSVNLAIEQIGDALNQVQTAASQVASTAQQMSSASEQLASGTQEQASSQEETSATLEQMTATVRQNADNARQANQLAAGARDTADNGGNVVRSAVSAMSEINSASKRIVDIITTIDEIAFQTNLLALNAAVEAARAGEQGRGFAVVASEVRSLAQRSASAAKEIKVLIKDSVKKVENGAELVGRSGQTLEEIVTSVKRVTDIVAEIAAASNEQATGIEQVSKAMSQMDQVTQTNSAQTEELSSTAQELSATAAHLQSLTGQFRLTHAATRDAAWSSPGRSMQRLTAPRNGRSPANSPGLGRLAQVAAGDDEFSGF